jgi:putative heme iron utilization protein
VHTDDAIFEFTGAIPAGEIGRGYFNLMQRTGCTGICGTSAAGRLCRAPLHGQAVGICCVLNVDGGIMFKVFVGRDETRALEGRPARAFKALADRIAQAVA